MSAPRLGSSRFADDDGRPDQALAAVLAARAPAREVAAALVAARLLVPVVAQPAAELAEAGQAPDHRAVEGVRTGLRADEGETAMATPLLVGRDGRLALPAFTSLAALTAWRADARPVPVLGPEAAVTTLDSEADLLVLDVAGPVSYVVSGGRLRALAEGRAWLPVAEDPEVAAAVGSIAGASPVVRSWSLVAVEEPGQATDARLELVLAPGATTEDASALGQRLAADPVLRVRLDHGLEIAAAVDEP